MVTQAQGQTLVQAGSLVTADGSGTLVGGQIQIVTAEPEQRHVPAPQQTQHNTIQITEGDFFNSNYLSRRL